MAEKTQDDAPTETPEQTDAEPRTQPVQETPAQQASRAFAESQQEAERLHLTETTPGGRYVVGDQTVDANGQPVKERGR